MTIDKELIEKFFRNQCTDTEAAMVQEYFAQHPEQAEQYLPLQEILADGPARLDEAVTERMLRRIRETYPVKGRVIPAKRLIWYAAAAVMLGIIVVSGKLLFRETEKEKTLAIAATVKKNSVQLLKTVENELAKPMDVRLPDGSAVRIFPGSRIRYLPDFEEDKRQLQLTGKAQFDVRKDVARPFTVTTTDVTVAVLGTSFVVTELTDHKTTIQLIAGSVAVRPRYAKKDYKQVILKPGDELMVTSDEQGSYTMKNVRRQQQALRPLQQEEDPASDTDALTFKNHRLKDIFSRMEERFGLVIKDETGAGIEEKLFTGKFMADDDREFILKTICNLHGLHYRIDGDTVLITK
ncbi:MAG: FecR family protein [Candidatus Pseudobacter hemicellulosilyticus]|uniref:FecR family protein n=1 Tax=Candidatus Pseudobacter hemicellulosilyticus TaxID=3121375 RepID=A0AAJ6BJK8_9BACT|nr:MAG: FecR family protein [Pseudobacter sp.]